MHDNEIVWQSSLIATALGLFSHYFAWLAVMPPWAMQAAVVMVTGPLLLFINHHLKRWLNKKWPDRNKRKPGDTGD